MNPGKAPKQAEEIKSTEDMPAKAPKSEPEVLKPAAKPSDVPEPEVLKPAAKPAETEAL